MAPHVKKLNLIAALALLLALAAAPALANMSGSTVDSVPPTPTVQAPANVRGSAVDSVSPKRTPGMSLRKSSPDRKPRPSPAFCWLTPAIFFASEKRHPHLA